MATDTGVPYDFDLEFGLPWKHCLFKRQCSRQWLGILVYAMLKRIICRQLKGKERLLLWCNNIHVSYYPV